MGKFLVRKVTDNGNEGFSETLEYHVMHQANVNSNHNKFYLIEIQRHTDGRHRLFTHYGRLGISNIYEVRDTVDGQPCRDYNEAKKEFDSIHKKKLSGKSVKDPDTGEVSREAYVDIDVVSPQVGSVNIRGVSEVKKTVTIKAAIDTSSYSKEVSALLDRLIEENVHSITTSTAIKYVAGSYMTEVGAVTKSHVDKARIPLNDLNKILTSKNNLDPEDREIRRLNSSYFSLIPKPFSRKISSEDMILTAEKLQAEYDILDQLETGVSMGSAMAGSTSSRMDALGTDVELFTDPFEVKRLTRMIHDSKANNHRGTDVWGYEVARIFKVKIPAERARYESRGRIKGNIKECYHGSSSSNILSILKQGMCIPPVNASHVCGRMMGAGAYFALSSTKSMNYSLGFWGGRRSKYNSIFLFVANLALGKYYETYSSMPGGTPKGYDSIWAKAGRSLYNDELVTPYLENQTLTYLVEMSK